MQLSELDSITWKLMTPTRSLESVFKAWAKGEATEAEVSDQYVRLGNEFIAAKNRLSQGGIPTDDLVNVPQKLRDILEEALALDCSPAVAEHFDPRIRAVMTQLFHQLKAKQLQLASSQQLIGSKHVTVDPANPSYANTIHPSPTSAVAAAPAPPRMVTTQAEPPAQKAQMSMQYPRTRTSHTHSHSRSHRSRAYNQPVKSGNTSSSSSQDQDTTSRYSGAYGSSESASSPTLHLPQIAAPDAPPSNEDGIAEEDDALSLLQRHGALERQASKRYSTRQISRMINGSAAEQRSLPTTGVHKTLTTPEYKDTNVFKEAAAKPGSIIIEEPAPPETPEQSIKRKTSMVRARSRKSSLPRGSLHPGDAPSSEPANQPLVSEKAATSPEDSKEKNWQDEALHVRPSSVLSRRSLSANAASSPMMGSNSGRSTVYDEFPVFMKVGSNIRKAMLARPPSIAAIRLRFIEVCAYVHSGDETFPEITIQDPKTGVDYEITEATVADVVEGSLLTLKVKTPEEISIEAEIKEIKGSIKDLVSKFDHSSLNARGASFNKSGNAGVGGVSPYAGAHSSKFPSPVLTGEGRFKLEKPPPPPREIAPDKVDVVLREIAVIRQLSNKTISNLRSEVQKLKAELKELSSSGLHSAISDRRSMDLIKEQMETTSQELLSQMENLSDIIDAQRVGIGSHGVRYPQKELDKVSRQLNAWCAEFEKSEQFIQNEKPLWKKTWQAELNNVIEDQEWLKSLDLLYSDLRSDLEQSMKTFELVCEANALPRKRGLRQGLPMGPPIKPGEEQAVADAVFQEIAALNLNHEQRAEAVQRAERLHRAKLALRSEEFEDELNTFVVDHKLKPNGGFEEVERRMKEREENARKLGEQSEAEARIMRERLKNERKAKRQAGAALDSPEKWHDVPADADPKPASGAAEGTELPATSPAPDNQ